MSNRVFKKKDWKRLTKETNEALLAGRSIQDGDTPAKEVGFRTPTRFGEDKLLGTPELDVVIGMMLNGWHQKTCISCGSKTQPCCGH